ncbi:hypothetical protein [Rhodococcus opacus]|uniref:hypothetical protein n=1 Tax=Rhodococcus opacus TaxID=37919 RepID=UPI001C44173C|nr:hypothetical protein [Rhodococcus opacus]MBV6758396.1 hypothetical protein [Rhodococcus opacus]
MSGYDWRAQADRLERENADLRNQADRAWTIANLTANAAMRHGVLIDEDGLGDHFLSLRAIDVHTAHQAAALERFRQAVVTLVHDARDAVDLGLDPAKVFASLDASLMAANHRSKNTSMQAAREQAEQELAAARFADLQLFTKPQETAA